MNTLTKREGAKTVETPVVAAPAAPAKPLRRRLAKRDATSAKSGAKFGAAAAAIADELLGGVGSDDPASQAEAADALRGRLRREAIETADVIANEQLSSRGLPLPVSRPIDPPAMVPEDRRAVLHGVERFITAAAAEREQTVLEHRYGAHEMIRKELFGERPAERPFDPLGIDAPRNPDGSAAPLKISPDGLGGSKVETADGTRWTAGEYILNCLRRNGGWRMIEEQFGKIQAQAWRQQFLVGKEAVAGASGVALAVWPGIVADLAAGAAIVGSYVEVGAFYTGRSVGNAAGSIVDFMICGSILAFGGLTYAAMAAIDELSQGCPQLRQYVRETAVAFWNWLQSWFRTQPQQTSL